MKQALFKLQDASQKLLKASRESGDGGMIETLYGNVSYTITPDGKYEIDLNGKKILFSAYIARCPLITPEDACFVRCEDWETVSLEDVPILQEVESYILRHFLGSVALIFFSILTPEGLIHLSSQIEQISHDPLSPSRSFN